MSKKIPKCWCCGSRDTVIQRDGYLQRLEQKVNHFWRAVCKQCIKDQSTTKTTVKNIFGEVINAC